MNGTIKPTSQPSKRKGWKTSRYRKNDYRDMGECAPVFVMPNTVDGDITKATLNSTTGLLIYIPTAEGRVDFRVKIVNESGMATPIIRFPMMVYNLTGTDSGNPDNPVQTYNNPPQLTLPDSHYIEAGKPYERQIIATDEDSNDTLTFTLTNPPNGMIINSSTGVISWLPETNLIGQTVKVSVSVSDSRGASSSGYFYLGITEPNKLPEVKNIAPQTVTAGAKFQYYVSAKDLDTTDRLTYSLDDAALALGMKIDANSGLITWTPTKNQIRDAAYPVIVNVTDGRSEPVSRPFSISVVEDTQAPNVTITATPSNASAGQTVTITVNATDNVGVKNTTLKLLSIRKFGETVINVNKEIELKNGRATYTLADNEFGILTFGATATDDAGNVSAVATTTVQAIDPSDTESPTVSIISHSQGSKIYGPVDIIGTVKDNEAGVYWTLKAVALDNGKEVLIASGTGNVENKTLGHFDTTMLRNGTYQIVLESTDIGGNKSNPCYFNVELEGDYKLGNFNMTFTDFDLQLGGLPITITRTYDTLNADVKGDFGYGWTLDILQYKMLVDYGDGELSEPNPYRGLQSGDTLYFVLPDGSKEGFVFTPQGGNSGGGLGGWLGGGMTGGGYMYAPNFTPMRGNKSELLYDNSRYITPSGYGLGYEDFYSTGETYTPFNGFYGGISIPKPPPNCSCRKLVYMLNCIKWC